MKLTWNCIAATTIVAAFALAPAFAQGKILYFDSDIIVNKDASIDVTENISVYAGEQSKIQDLTRKLPSYYTDSSGGIHAVTYKIRQVLLNNKAVSYRLMAPNALAIHNNAAGVDIYTYTIQYHANNAVSTVKDEQEFNWNLTGNEWTLPVIKVEASIHLPAKSHILHFSGYTGKSSQKKAYFYAREESDNEISFVSTLPLQPGEGLNIALAWKKYP